MTRAVEQSGAQDDYCPPERLIKSVPRAPSHISIEPTTRCNLQCAHCAHGYSRFGQDMALEVFHKIRDTVLSDVASIDLVGYGEPLLSSLFDEMFDECVKRGLNIHIITNGVLLRSDSRLARLVENKVTLTVSVDGIRPETYEFVRHPAKWENLLSALERVKRAAEAAGPRKRFRMRFHFVAMKRNISDLPGLVDLAAEYGIDKIFILPLLLYDIHEKMTGQSLHDSPQLLAPPLYEALRRAARLKVQIPVPSFFRELIVNGPEAGHGLKTAIMRQLRKIQLGVYYIRFRGVAMAARRLWRGFGPRSKTGIQLCAMPWRSSYITTDGGVYPCCITMDPLGNLNHQDWREIWTGPLYENVRRTINGWNPPAACRCCGQHYGIYGGDEKGYERFFSRFRRQDVPLDSPAVHFGHGFYDLERTEEGAPSHRWMTKRGRLSLPMRRKAKFLRFIIANRMPFNEANPGKCRINSGSGEPFDNTCPELTFPLDHVKTDRLDVEMEMANCYRLGTDTRDLALAIRGIQYLF